LTISLEGEAVDTEPLVIRVREGEPVFDESWVYV